MIFISYDKSSLELDNPISECELSFGGIFGLFFGFDMNLLQIDGGNNENRPYWDLPSLIWPHKWIVGLDLGPRITQGACRLAGHLCFFKKDSESCPSSAISCILFGF